MHPAFRPKNDHLVVWYFLADDFLEPKFYFYHTAAAMRLNSRKWSL